MKNNLLWGIVLFILTAAADSCNSQEWKELIEMIKTEDTAKIEAVAKSNPQLLNNEIDCYGIPLF